MIKHIASAISVIALMLGLVGIVGILKTAPVSAAVAPKVTICHRTNSVTNPYVQNTVAQSAVDGVGNSDHYGEHKGPVATSEAVAQILKDNKINWGDIIPPVPNVHAGLNWTTEGQIIYRNNCNLPLDEEEEGGVSNFVIECELLTLLAPTLQPEDVDYQYYLDGEAVALGDYALEAGEYELTLVVGESTFDTDSIIIEACEEEGQPDVSVALECNLETKTFTMTLTNDGTAESNISLNEEEFVLAAESSVEKEIVDDGNGVAIELIVDGEVYGEYDGTRPFFCKQGGGSVTPETPVTDVTSLPVTGGSLAPLASLIAIVTTIVTAAGGYVLQSRTGSSL